MATVVSRVIAASGGDYTSYSTWESGEQRDLVLADEISLGLSRIRGANLVLGGYVTDASRFVHLKADTGYQHAGKWDTTSAAAVSSQFNSVINVGNDAVIEGLLVENTSTVTSGNHAGVNRTSSAVVRFEVIGCVVRHTGGASTLTSGANFGIRCAGGGCRIINNVVIGFKGSGIAVEVESNFTQEVFNNTVDNDGSQIMATPARCFSIVRSSTGDTNYLARFANNLAVNTAGRTEAINTSAAWAMAFDLGADNLVTDGNLPSSTNPDVSLSTGITFADRAGGDYTVTAGDSIDAGTDLSAYGFSTDILGATRSGTWDIGAFESAPSVFTFVPTTVIAAAGYTREDDSSTEAALLAGLAAGGDGLYVRSPLTPTGTPFKVGNITLDTSRVGVALNYEYGKDGAATINQTIQLRSADGTQLIREAVHNNVAARPLTASMDLSDLTLSGSYSVWAIDVQV